MPNPRHLLPRRLSLSSIPSSPRPDVDTFTGQKRLASPVKSAKLSPIKTSEQPPSPKKEPQTYASLPPSPISPALPPFRLPKSQPSHPPFSIWDYLREELLATDFDSHQELKWERVSNFLSIPVAIEKVCRQ